jgi:predicted nucleotidyltransferase
MNLDSLNDDFRDLLLALADHKVEFVIVGAYALSFYGAPRASGDIDIFVRPSSGNSTRLWDALVEFGVHVEAAGVVATDFIEPDLVYQIGLPPRRIDLHTSISGVTFDEAWYSRVPAEVSGRVVHFIGREMFIRNKQAAGRPKDLADAARLMMPGK